jgi:hypothetical protein
MLGGLDCIMGSGGAAAAPYLLQEQPRMIIMHLRTIPGGTYSRAGIAEPAEVYVHNGPNLNPRHCLLFLNVTFTTLLKRHGHSESGG